MLLNQLSKRPFWLQMLVVGFASLGATCFAGMGLFLWLNVAGRRPTPPTAPVPPPAPPQQALQSPTPSPAPAQPVDIKTDDYEREIWYLREKAKIEKDGAEKMVAAGGLSQAKAMLGDASYRISMASCMEDQAKRNVAFYQGKATCATAVSADR